MRLLNKTSNPAFSNYFWDGNNSSSSKMSLTGIFIKSLFCISIISGITIFIWQLYLEGVTIKWFTTGGMIAAIILSIIISVRQSLGWILVPLYAIAKGCFIGGITAFAHAKFPNLPYQAIGVTIITFFVVLILYQTRIIKVTQQLKSIILSAAASIFAVYIISFILGIFGIKVFIWGNSIAAIIFNIFAAFFASLSLLLDFDYIEHHKNKSSKSKEWIATWGLLVTIVWLYAEILRLMKKLAIRF